MPSCWDNLPIIPQGRLLLIVTHINFRCVSDQNGCQPCLLPPKSRTLLDISGMLLPGVQTGIQHCLQEDSGMTSFCYESFSFWSAYHPELQLPSSHFVPRTFLPCILSIHTVLPKLIRLLGSSMFFDLTGLLTICWRLQSRDPPCCPFPAPVPTAARLTAIWGLLEAVLCHLQHGRGTNQADH